MRANDNRKPTPRGLKWAVCAALFASSLAFGEGATSGNQTPSNPGGLDSGLSAPPVGAFGTTNQAGQTPAQQLGVSNAPNSNPTSGVTGTQQPGVQGIPDNSGLNSTLNGNTTNSAGTGFTSPSFTSPSDTSQVGTPGGSVGSPSGTTVGTPGSGTGTMGTSTGTTGPGSVAGGSG